MRKNRANPGCKGLAERRNGRTDGAALFPTRCFVRRARPCEGLQLGANREEDHEANDARGSGTHHRRCRFSSALQACSSRVSRKATRYPRLRRQRRLPPPRVPPFPISWWRRSRSGRPGCRPLRPVPPRYRFRTATIPAGGTTSTAPSPRPRLPRLSFPREPRSWRHCRVTPPDPRCSPGRPPARLRWASRLPRTPACAGALRSMRPSC